MQHSRPKTKDFIRSYVSAYKNLVQNFPAGIVTPVQYDNITNDLLLEYNQGGNYRFAPIRAGRYLVIATISILNVGVPLVNILTIDNNAGVPLAFQRHVLDAAFAETYHVSCIIYLTPNDWIQVNFHANPASAFVNTVAGAECTFYVARIG